ncbi:class I SAM-dependent methyltransferase [Catenuloplanes japonicus]|uniref:class I SAM-dependent methyltransferase n=1 Tax=Catenuloplanes japonicus TaxID=33876 RepID=UPI000527F466|nr:class I SAM-dependent methyltransferase [Catenuloplanes japonicus]
MHTAEINAASWVERWDRQQELYVPDRDHVFALMLDIVERVAGVPTRVLDLACGPGGLAWRARTRWPDADVFGVDLDPALMELGRRTLGDTIEWIEADLRDPRWADRLGDEPLDAVLSATALHWLDPDDTARLMATLGKRIRPGGVFANYDTIPPDANTPRLQELAVEFREPTLDPPAADGVEDWAAWWAALAQEPAMTALLAERERRFADRSRRAATTVAEFTTALREAGFTEVGTLRQVADRTLLVAIR